MKVRKRPWLRIPPLALAALALAGPAEAGVRVTGVDISAYPQIRATVTVPAGTAQPRLWENGHPVPGLRSTNLGAGKVVVLAIDRSRSMKGRPLADAIAAANAFVEGKRAGDRLKVVTFGHAATSLTPFLGEGTTTATAIEGIDVDRSSGTALWDAIVVGARALAKEDRPGHVLIVLTDGHDVSSVASRAQAVEAAHKAKASVYPVAVAGPDFTPEPLRELAAETGGRYHQASSSSELAAIYRSIGNELARTWELRYPTAARPGETLRLVVSAPGAGRSTRTAALPALGAGTTAAVGPSPVLPEAAWTSGLAPFVVSAAVAFLVLLACAFWFAARQGRWVRRRLEPHLGAVKRDVKARRRTQRQAFFGRIFSATEHAFSNVKQFRTLQRLIERADLPLRAAELLYIALGVAFVLGLLIGVLAASPLVSLVAMAIGGSLPIAYVYFKASSRVKAFDNQLPDLLITMAASLKAGHSFRQGIQAVVDEGAEPAATEFKRVLTETRLGRPMDDALAEMSTRVGSKNLAFVITSVTIQRQIGGSLAGLFDMVADTVRQRQQFARKIKGLTAMGRMSAYVLIGLPFFLAFVLTIMNGKYMAPLYNTGTGHKLIFAGLGMMTFGTLILKKMVSFRG